MPVESSPTHSMTGQTRVAGHFAGERHKQRIPAVEDHRFVDCLEVTAPTGKVGIFPFQRVGAGSPSHFCWFGTSRCSLGSGYLRSSDFCLEGLMFAIRSGRVGCQMYIVEIPTVSTVSQKSYDI